MIKLSRHGRYLALFGILAALVVVSGYVGHTYFAVSTNESYALPNRIGFCDEFGLSGSSCGQRVSFGPSTKQYSTVFTGSGANLVIGSQRLSGGNYLLLDSSTSGKVIGLVGFNGNGTATIQNGSGNGGNGSRVTVGVRTVTQVIGR